MSDYRIYPLSGHTCRCPACPFGVMDKPTHRERLKHKKTGENSRVLRVHPLASLMRTRVRACNKIAVRGRTDRTEKILCDCGSYSGSPAVELSNGQTPGGRTRRTNGVFS